MTRQSQSTLDRPTAERLDDDDIGGTHLFCCDPDRSLCGLDMTGWESTGQENDTDCAVCADLSEQPCRPGCRP